MSQYVVDSSRTLREPQRFVLAVPLAITLIFCFGFVTMHPAKNGDSVSASSGADNSIKQADLSDIPLSSSPPTTLSTVEESSAANTDQSIASGTGPKTIPSASSPKTTAPQSASQSHGDNKFTIQVGNTKVSQ